MRAGKASGFGRRLFFFWVAALGVFASITAESASDDGIRAEVHGRLRTLTAPAPGFQVSAGAIVWDLDLSANAALLQAAQELDGKPVVVSGVYAERRTSAGVRRVLVAKSLRSDGGKGGERVDVTARGTLKTGVMAIGAETTGITLDAGGVNWELQLHGKRAREAAKLDGRRVVVIGRLTHRRGVEMRERFVVEVRSLREERGMPSPRARQTPRWPGAQFPIYRDPWTPDHRRRSGVRGDVTSGARGDVTSGVRGDA